MHHRLCDSEKSIFVGQYQFAGPYVNLNVVSERPGLLALFAESDGELELLSLHEAANLKHFARFVSHEDYIKLSVGVLYTTDLSPEERAKLRDDVLHTLESCPLVIA